jgi:hypothetical protein
MQATNALRFRPRDGERWNFPASPSLKARIEIVGDFSEISIRKWLAVLRERGAITATETDTRSKNVRYRLAESVHGRESCAAINLVNAARLHIFNGKPSLRTQLAAKRGHRLYLHENNM